MNNAKVLREIWKHNFDKKYVLQKETVILNTGLLVIIIIDLVQKFGVPLASTQNLSYDYEKQCSAVLDIVAV